jgi:hypothetical protein
MASHVSVETYVEVDLTVRVKMSNYGAQWPMNDMFEQVMREGAQQVKDVFNGARISGYTIRKVKATAVIVDKEQL